MDRSVQRRATVTVTVDRPMNHHGTMTVVVTETNEVRHLVEFAGDVRPVLADLPPGTTIPVEMRQLPSRGSCWRVTDVGPSARSE
jgi:hypothetical protein